MFDFIVILCYTHKCTTKRFPGNPVSQEHHPERLVREVLYTTGITATCGIGTKLYLAKIAMDIEAKHSPPDRDGVRIAELDEFSCRTLLWDHRPLTDFWRIGHSTAKKLEKRRSERHELPGRRSHARAQRTDWRT